MTPALALGIVSTLVLWLASSAVMIWRIAVLMTTLKLTVHDLESELETVKSVRAEVEKIPGMDRKLDAAHDANHALANTVNARLAVLETKAELSKEHRLRLESSHDFSKG